MKTNEVKQNQGEEQVTKKPQFSNLDEQDLREKISTKEVLLSQLESKLGKIEQDFKQFEKIKEEFELLIKQSTVPFRLMNSIWFNRPSSIFFSVKAT